jgi:hypothetical protein
MMWCDNQGALTWVDTSTDTDFCGGCDTSCVGYNDNGVFVPPTCIDGVCGCEDEHLDACPSATTNGKIQYTCADTQTSRRFCGSSCDTAVTCGVAQDCDDGECVCTFPLQMCGTDCVDTSGDAAHCGECNHACGTNETCVAGECTCQNTVCPPNGACVDPQTDSNNCGGCGQACAAGTTCRTRDFGDGTPPITRCCAPGFSICPSPANGCVDTQNDAQNCGSCNFKCGTNQQCVLGFCQTLIAAAQPADGTGAACTDGTVATASCTVCSDGTTTAVACHTCAGGATTAGVCPL